MSKHDVLSDAVFKRRLIVMSRTVCCVCGYSYVLDQHCVFNPLKGTVHQKLTVRLFQTWLNLCVHTNTEKEIWKNVSYFQI